MPRLPNPHDRMSTTRVSEETKAVLLDLEEQYNVKQWALIDYAVELLQRPNSIREVPKIARRYPARSTDPRAVAMRESGLYRGTGRWARNKLAAERREAEERSGSEKKLAARRTTSKKKAARRTAK